MKLISVLNVGESVLDEQLFRTSTIRDAVAFGIFFILFLACVGHYTWYSLSYSVGFWGHTGDLRFGFGFGTPLKWAIFSAPLRGMPRSL